MSGSNKIVNATVRLFNLLTFLAAIWVFFGYCQIINRELAAAKKAGDLILLTLMFAINAGIVWKTGHWLTSKAQQIFVPALLVFWMLLFFIYMLVELSGWAGAGPGSGG